MSTQPSKSSDTGFYDPWAASPGCDVYERSNEFSETTVCKTIVIIDQKNSKYYSINTYNGIAKAGRMEYEIKDLKKLIHKLQKKGYTQLTKGSSSSATA